MDAISEHAQSDNAPFRSDDDSNGRSWRRKDKLEPKIGLKKPSAAPLPDDVIPPQALEAEMCLLGALILDREVINDAMQHIDSEAVFYVPQHRTLYRVLVELYNAGRGWDLVLLRDELSSRQLLDDIGGVDYLVRLVEGVPDTQNAEHYAHTVKAKSMLRDLLKITQQIEHEVYTSPLPADQILDAAEREMFKVSHRRESGAIEHIGGLITEAFAHLDSADGEQLTGVSCGFTELNGKLSGLQRGEMIIVAARPSMGKTAFALNVLDHIGVDCNTACALFSMEMSRQAVTTRMLCTRAEVDSVKFRRGFVSEAEVQKLQIAAGQLQAAPIFIDDSVGLSPMALRARCRRLAAQHDIQCIMVDYLQLMRSPGAESRTVEIGQISSGIKQIARELNVPVIALAQLNRGVEGREGHKPRMSDLRESGSIEQDADVVMLLHRESYYRPDDESVQGKAQVIIAKQRNGPVGEIDLLFFPELARFRNPYHGMGDEYAG